ncbi:MAG: dihydroorotate dehydrogenase [Parcubacteria group bacterium Gr01-1014_31]|nr:MAG: dihydroorotate dehydrogenase [Parcubacteria group bacterium Gr01-1014_31]
MILRGIDFGNVLNASGARGFFGEGYPFHRFFEPFGLNYEGSTFVAKTTTLHPRLRPHLKEGNMPLGADGITPAEFKPACIKVRLWQGITLNAVGLSGPGAERLLREGRWELLRRPFFISFMGMGDKAQRLRELREFVQLLVGSRHRFIARFGLKINFSCPNVGLRPAELVEEVGEALEIAAPLGVPLVPKLNATVPVEPVVDVSRHAAFDALCISNTIPWGQLPERINWRQLWGTNVSPLAHLGGGGMSGPPLLSIVCDWIRQARTAGLSKPIIGGGGIISRGGVDQMLVSGATAISLGTVSIVRPWRVQRLIRYANACMAWHQRAGAVR